MKGCGKWIILGFLVVTLLTGWAMVSHADSRHDKALTPADCIACHNVGLVTEHSGLPIPNPIDPNSAFCDHCHLSTDLDIKNSIIRGRHSGGILEEVYCAFCHQTASHTVRVHNETDLGAGHIEHDRAVTDPSCSTSGCHPGSDINAIHIDTTYGADLDTKLSCYTCHSRTNATVTAAVDSGMAGNDVSCGDCHGVAHGSDHDHALIDAPECADCHAANVVEEHLVNQGLACATCHNTTYQAIIDIGTAGTDVYCYDCHGATDHSTAHAPVSTALLCLDCHSAELTVEHIDDQGLTCNTCHSSGDQNVIDAITAGSGGATLFCESCHVTFAGHVGDHDHAIITAGNCIDCHSNDINVEHIDNHGLTCTTCHDSENGAVVAAITLGRAGTDVDCNTCHGVVDHAAAHNHAVITLGDCNICHSSEVTVEHITNQGLTCLTCHDNADAQVVTAIATGSGPSGTDVDCEACHNSPTDHSQAHDQTVITTGNCIDCHNGDINIEHTNQGYDCYVCHISGDSLVMAAIADGIAGTNVNCDACHGTTDHSAAHNHTVISAPFCADCHSADINVEHITNLGLACNVCHISSDPLVVDAIALGISGTDVNCDACHGTTDHSAAHDHAVITAAFCAACHSADINVEHIDNHGLTCATCHDSVDPSVSGAIVLGISGVDVNCDACHGSVDHAGAHDHAVITSGDCVDCHSPDINIEHIDNHGLTCATCHASNNGLVIAAINTGSGPAGTDVDCNACHGVVDHNDAHDHAIMPDSDCQRCHSPSVVIEHAAHGFSDCNVCHGSSDSVIVDAIADGIAGNDVTCDVCHPAAAAWHATAHDRIYLRTRVGVTETVITSTDDPADGFYDDLAAYLPSLTCGGCHAGIAENHWGNFHSGLRVADLFDSGGNPLPRGAIDPARPWITGPGMVGNWCATYNRQLPDLTAAFADEVEFAAKVDLGIFEFVRECGSCHVGGGPGVENPFGFSGYASDALDDPLRAAALDGGTAPLNAWDFYVENDGSVTRGNWADSGILDVDCFICHLDGYDHLTRNTLIRGAARFGQAAAVGAGLATPDELSPDKLDYNSLQVFRDAGNQLYLSHNLTYRIAGAPPQDNCMACHLPSMVVNENQVEKPDQWQKNFYTAVGLPSLDPENPDPLLAANRKSALYRNDMLKRGATWRRDEVHKFMECTGCHSRTSKTQAYNPVSASETYLHSPGKGYDPLKYPSPADGTVKLCEDCHVDYGDLNNDGIRDTLAFAPPEMKVYHAQAGLLAKVVPSARQVVDAAGNEETFVGSHIDIISCVACHVKKRSAAARSVDYATGAGYYNLVGAPLDQVPSNDVVELAYSWRDNGGSKVIDGQPNPDWRRQIFPFNYLTSSFWDDTGGLDANGDGFNIGDFNGFTVVVGDPIFLRTIRARFAYDYINMDNNRVASGLLGVANLDERGEWLVAGQDGNVLFTRGLEIDAFQAAMAGYVPQLTLEAQPFLVTHNVMPIRNVGAGSGWETFALGAPQRDTLGRVVSYGCGDCHGGSGGLFNGTVNMLGKGRLISDDSEIPLTVTWNEAGDVKTVARAWNREGAVQEVDFSTGNQTRDPERREFLGYDAGRQAFLNNIVPADYGFGVEPVADIALIGTLSADGLPPDEVNWATATSDPIAIDLDSTVDLVAAPAGTSGTFSYRWNINDEPGTLIGSTVEKSFNHPGLWRILLTVIDEEGRISQNLQKVNVVRPSAGTIVTVATAAANPTVNLSLSGLPAHDQIKFYFGDGTRLYVDSDTPTYAFNRDYRLVDTYFMNYDPDTKVRHDPLNDPTPGNEYQAWVYKTSVRLYQGLTWVETVNVQVIIPAP